MKRLNGDHVLIYTGAAATAVQVNRRRWTILGPSLCFLRRSFGCSIRGLTLRKQIEESERTTMAL